MNLPILVESYVFNRQIKILSILDENKEHITFRTNDAFPLYRYLKISRILQHEIEGRWKDIKLENKKIQERLF